MSGGLYTVSVWLTEASLHRDRSSDLEFTHRDFRVTAPLARTREKRLHHVQNLGLVASDDSSMGSQPLFVGNLIQKTVFKSINWSINVLLGDAGPSMFGFDHFGNLAYKIICLRLEFLMIWRANIQPELPSLFMLVVIVWSL